MRTLRLVENEEFRVSKVISVRLSEDEELRIKAAAAVAGVPVSGYLRWLMSQARTQNDTETILRRLDLLGAMFAMAAIGVARSFGAPLPAGLPRDTFARLRERGIPSSTIRQIEAVWDEAASKSAPRAPLLA